MKDVWDLLPTKEETGGIWQRVSQEKPKPFIPGQPNLWTSLGNQPGGLWQDLEGETLLLDKPWRSNIWDEINDETLIIYPQLDIWHELDNSEIDSDQGLGVWTDIDDETLIIPHSEVDVWSMADLARDITRLKPTRKLGWAIKKFSTSSGSEYYILKNMRSGMYLRLSEQQIFLWNLMDGEHTIKDIAVAYFIHYKSLAIQRLLLLLDQLENKGFLIKSGQNVYSNTEKALNRKPLNDLRRRLWGTFSHTTFPLRDTDLVISKMYHSGIFLLFTPAAQILISIITLIGLFTFGYHLYDGTYSVLTGGGEFLILGLAGLFIAQFCAIFLHEASHAFTCKHYGRDVRRAGFMIYLGMPVFFVDTTDIWMEPRRPRLLVSLAGAYSGLFLAASASILILLMPYNFVSGLLFQFAFACILLSFTNLNPLLSLDGYYILMDWLEMPMLRARALYFIQGALWKKIRLRESFNREEWIFTIYGLLSVGWTVIAVLIVLLLFWRGFQNRIQSLLGPDLGLVIMMLLTVGLIILLIWPLARTFIIKRGTNK
jgi:putative peptide zinc metalloprotease protein